MNSLNYELEPLRRLVVARLRLLLSAWESNIVLDRSPPDGLAAELHPDEQVVFRLLVAPRPVEAAEVLAALGDACVTALARLGVIRSVGAIIESPGLRLRCVNGMCLLTGDAGPGHLVHFGVDSLALMNAAMSVRGATRGLELCCGSAAAAIRLTSTHGQVVACELYPKVAGTALINAVLNDATNLEVRCGDLWVPVFGERFDTIVANPPFTPSVSGQLLDPVADGGADGLDFARAIWSSASSYLSPGGILLLLIGMFGDGENVLIESELIALAAQNRWLVELIEPEPPRPVERLTMRTFQSEPSETRLKALRINARAVGASHYQVALLRMAAHDMPTLVRRPVYLPAAEALRLRLKTARSQRGFDRHRSQ